MLWLTPLLMTNFGLGSPPVAAKDPASSAPRPILLDGGLTLENKAFSLDSGNKDEVVITPDGVNNSPSWALEQIGTNYPDGNAFTYPDTTNPVRLYLIDTAIANPASWTAANPKLTFEGTVLVRGSTDPTTSTPRPHATQLLSLISGMETGISPGTPIRLLNYDIYPNPTTTVTLMAQAIFQAVQHSKAAGTVKMRSVIYVASSSVGAGDSFALEDMVDFAISEGIPVILSAGNQGEDAASHVPPTYGTKSGVVCVGSSDSNGLILSSSNFGAPVDLLSPGANIPTRAESATSPLVGMNGTSPASAFVAGLALTELSINGSLSPAQVESRIKDHAFLTSAGMKVLRTTPAVTYVIENPDGPVILPSGPLPLGPGSNPVQPRGPVGPASGGSSPTLDSDSDGVPDIVEAFHGASSALPPPSTLSVVSPGVVQFRFPVSSELFRNSSPFVLSDGSTWSVNCSSDFKVWGVPTGSLLKSTDANGQVWLTATFPGTVPSCFARIGVTPKP